MSDWPPLDDATLHAWVDGQLTPERRLEVEAQLAGDPALAARAGAYRRQRQALHNAFDAVLDQPLPRRLQPRAMPRPRWPAAVAAALLIGIGLGWSGAGLLRPAAPSPTNTAAVLPAEAALAYAVYTPEVRHPVMVGANEKKHLLHWLSKRLDHPLRAPDLHTFGYRLMGGSLLPGNAGPAAQFMYQNTAGQRITLYITWPRKPLQRTAFRFVNTRGVEVFYWIDNGLAYAVAGHLDRAELLRIAESVYRQLGA